MDTTLIACSHTIFSKLKYQIVLRNNKKGSCLYSVNLIDDKTIIKKIKKEDTNIEFIVENAEDIAREIMIRSLKSDIAKTNVKKKNKVKINKAARQKTADDLLNQFNYINN